MLIADVRAILFDLDGTLLDTAPDLVGAANQTLKNHNFPTQPLEKLRYFAGIGTSSLICAAFEINKEHSKFADYRAEFIDIYQNNLTVNTRFFDGVPFVLDQLDMMQMPWGIVTNKPIQFSTPVLQHFGLEQRAQCVVCGDSLEKGKPHPEPLWHACKLINSDPKHTLYIGDTLTDFKAANAAGIRVIAALYGYDRDYQQHLRLADGSIEAPMDILSIVR